MNREINKLKSYVKKLLKSKGIKNYTIEITTNTTIFYQTTITIKIENVEDEIIILLNSYNKKSFMENCKLNAYNSTIEKHLEKISY